MGRRKLRSQNSTDKTARNTPADDKNNFPTTVLIVAILALTFTALFPSLKSSWSHVDDQLQVLENPAITGLDFAHLKMMFTRTVLTIYVPLTYLSYAIDYKIAGYHPFIYHLVNLVLHLAVTALVFLVGMRLGLSRWAAAVGSLLFGVHPMHVESVAWITERKDVLYAFFYLLSVVQYLRFLDGRKKSAYFWSLFFGLLSILAKPMALSLPLVLLVCDWFKRRKFTTQIFFEKIPYFLCIMPIAAITYAMNARVPGENFFEGILTWIWSLTFYFKKFLFPVDVYPNYMMPNPVALTEPTILSALSILILLIVCIFCLRKDRWFIFACLYFFVSIFFLLRFDDINVMHAVADRFMYLPSLGFCLWLGFLAEKASQKPLAIILVSLILFSLGFKTFQQSALWNREVDLWSYVITKEHNSFFAYNTRGNIYLDEKNCTAATMDFSKAIALRPDYAPAYINRGLCYEKNGQNDLALQDYDAAVKIGGHDLNAALINRGFLYVKLKKDDLALADFNKAIEINPQNPYVYNNRGGIYVRQGKDDLALADFNRALELRKDLVKVYLQRSAVYYHQKNFNAAYDDVLKIKSLGGKVKSEYFEDLKRKTGR